MKQSSTSPHPNQEDWMSFLYGEDTPERHEALDAHLRSCAECRSKVQLWRESQLALDAWTLPAPQPRNPRFPRRFLPWAAAAVLLLGLGLGLGRITSPAAAEIGALRASLESELDAKLAAARTELIQVLDHHQSELAQALRAAATEAASTEASQLLAQYAKTLEKQRDADHESYLTALLQIDERRRSDVGTLREQIQTVALNTDDGLTRTQEQLIKLASVAGSTP